MIETSVDVRGVGDQGAPRSVADVDGGAVCFSWWTVLRSDVSFL